MTSTLGFVSFVDETEISPSLAFTSMFEKSVLPNSPVTVSAFGTVLYVIILPINPIIKIIAAKTDKRFILIMLKHTFYKFRIVFYITNKTSHTYFRHTIRCDDDE